MTALLLLVGSGCASREEQQELALCQVLLDRAGHAGSLEEEHGILVEAEAHCRAAGGAGDATQRLAQASARRAALAPMVARRAALAEARRRVELVGVDVGACPPLPALMGRNAWACVPMGQSWPAYAFPRRGSGAHRNLARWCNLVAESDGLPHAVGVGRGFLRGGSDPDHVAGELVYCQRGPGDTAPDRQSGP